MIVRNPCLAAYVDRVRAACALTGKERDVAMLLAWSGLVGGVLSRREPRRMSGLWRLARRLRALAERVAAVVQAEAHPEYAVDDVPGLESVLRRGMAVVYNYGYPGAPGHRGTVHRVREGSVTIHVGERGYVVFDDCYLAGCLVVDARGLTIRPAPEEEPEPAPPAPEMHSTGVKTRTVQLGLI